jgi:diguanylate cyclase (GGDEF)-like protein/PAS domain S-box-containing protein
VWGPEAHTPIRFAAPNIQILGHSAQAVVANKVSLLDLIHDEDRGTASAQISKKLLARTQRFQLRARLATPTGIARWVDIWCVPEYADSGAVLQIPSVLIEVTDLVTLQSKLTLYLETLGDLLVVLDRTGRVVGVNKAVCELTAMKEYDLVGIDWIATFVPSASADEIRTYFHGLMSDPPDHPVPHYENEIVLPNGQHRVIEWRQTIERDERGEATGLVAIGSDITNYKNAREEAGRYATFPLANPNPVFSVDSNGDVLLANPAGQDLLAALSSGAQDAVEKGRQAWSNMIKRALEASQRFRHELTLEEVIYLVDIVPDAAAQKAKLYCTDITELRQAQAQIEKFAFQDALTGLSNRRLLEDRLTQALAEAKRTERSFALLMLDLDHFKRVNDSLGHSAGDELLKQVSRRLQGLVRAIDTIARLGGDEFVILQRNVSDPVDAVVLAQKVLREFEEPFNLDGEWLKVATSIGVTVADGRPTTASELLEEADIALYEVKETERGTFKMHSATLTDSVRHRIDISRRLDRAIESDEFILHYQPQIRLSDQTVIGVEALIRWADNDGHLISPAEFLPVAESYGQLKRIGTWVFRAAVMQVEEWRRAHEGDVPVVSINVAAVQMRDPTFSAECIAVLDDFKVPASAIELEILESSYLQANEAVQRNIEAFQAAGIEFALDDFGTGYSSLAFLQALPIRRLKIAQELVRKIVADKGGRAIVAAAIAMAKELKLEILAEGAETKEVVDLLKDMGCEVVQGYYFAKPLAAEDAINFKVP